MTKSIERLSKGQNNWELLTVQLPEALMDIGAHQLPAANIIMLFGGSSENLVKNVHFYITEGEGRFDNSKTTEL